ncbi:uncharacterized protein LOC135157287 [Lytechinus pictus]|uniref:uncharacterized protein LOC135157287 n=1 Tax=Lytechinus pictus TaxID=7653 RepID=UPI0030B9F264
MNALDMSNRRYACSQCNRTYSRKFDMQRHEQKAHPDTEDEGKIESSDAEEGTSEDDYSEPPSQTEGVEESSDSENDGEDESSMSETDNMDEIEDNPAYQVWLEQAMTATKDLRDEKYQKYISEGMEEEDAKEKAHVKLLWAVKRIFFDLYSKFLQQNISLGEADVNHEIVSDLKERLENGMEFQKAVQRVLARHGPQFDGLFQFQDGGDDDDDDEETESEDGVYN